MPRKCHRPTFGKTVKPFMGLFEKFGVVIPTELCQAPGICFCFLQRTYVFTGIVTSRCGMTDDRNLWIHTLALHLLFKITFFIFIIFKYNYSISACLCLRPSLPMLYCLALFKIHGLFLNAEHISVYTYRYIYIYIYADIYICICHVHVCMYTCTLYNINFIFLGVIQPQQLWLRDHRGKRVWRKQGTV